MGDYTLFVDESGHVGMNYLDEHQPLHVSAGFLVRNAAIPSLEMAMQRARPVGAVEVKGATLLQSAAGRRRAASLIEAVGQAGGIPFYVVMERRFCVAGKLVDVFLDPLHQPGAVWLPTAQFGRRHAITETIVRLAGDDVLDRFAEEYRRPSQQGFRVVLETLVTRLRGLREERLALSFEGAIPALERIVVDETYTSDEYRHGQWAALNVPAVRHLLSLVDTFVDASQRRFDVLHDATDEFGPALSHAIDTLRAPSAAGVDIRIDGGRSLRAFFRNLDGFSLGQSHLHPGLQAADVLAATVNRVGRSALSATRFDESLTRLAYLTLPALMHDDDDPIPAVAGVYVRMSTPDPSTTPDTAAAA